MGPADTLVFPIWLFSEPSGPRFAPTRASLVQSVLRTLITGTTEDIELQDMRRGSLDMDKDYRGENESLEAMEKALEYLTYGTEEAGLWMDTFSL